VLLCFSHYLLINPRKVILVHVQHPFNGPLSGTTRVSRYQKGKTNLDFTEARDSEWQWHHLGHMPVCTLLQTDNHASTPPLSFLQAGCPSCRPTNSVKALKAISGTCIYKNKRTSLRKFVHSVLSLFCHTNKSRCIMDGHMYFINVSRP